MSDKEINDELSSDTSFDKAPKNENDHVDDTLFKLNENTTFTESMIAEKIENVVPSNRVSRTIDVQNHPLLNSLVNTLLSVVCMYF